MTYVPVFPVVTSSKVTVGQHHSSLNNQTSRPQPRLLDIHQ